MKVLLLEVFNFIMVGLIHLLYYFSIDFVIMLPSSDQEFSNRHIASAEQCYGYKIKVLTNPTSCDIKLC